MKSWLRQGNISDALILSNNFNVLRIIAALLVLFSHSFPLSGAKTEPFLQLSGYESYGGVGITIFFVISGFLITGSLLRSKSVGNYLIKRFLRITPGLIAACLFCALIVGPLVTDIPISSYFLNGQVYYFIFHNIILFPVVYNLPGVFAHNVYPDAVNGSLWSLPYEVGMYIVMAASLVVGLAKKSFFAPLLLLSLLVLNLLINPRLHGLSLLHLDGQLFINLATYFLVGSLLYLWGRRIPLSPMLAIALFALYIASWHSPYALAISYLALPYLVIFLAFFRGKKQGRRVKTLDLSYGIYLYAFPVQQLMMHSFNNLGPLGLFSLSIIIVVPLAYLSWTLVESPSLSLKSKLVTLKTNPLNYLNRSTRS